MNEAFQVILLGIIEGLTEFIPVSSTGHLILVGKLIKFTIPNKETFKIFIQLGAILSVLVLYYDVFISLFSRRLQIRVIENELSPWHIIIACLPTFLCGFLLYEYITSKLIDSSVVVAVALIVGGVIMIFIERQTHKVQTDRLESLTIRQALLIGLFQCFALWPGMSRSAATIIGGVLCGLSRKVAAEFSFIVAVPVILAAVLYDLYKNFANITSAEINSFTLGFIVAFVVALISIKLFMSIIQRVSLAAFGVYRIILGAIVLAIIYR